MKKILLLCSLIGMLVFQGCEGPAGPEGVPGQPGRNVESEVFELTRDFNPQNDFSSLVQLNPAIYESDVVLVYLLWDVDGNTPIWRLMPQTVQLNEGDLQYNFDFTRFDVNLFLSSADFDLTILGAQWTQDQTFRIVIVPGYFSNKNAVDYSNYDTVIKAFNIDESKIKKID